MTQQRARTALHSVAQAEQYQLLHSILSPSCCCVLVWCCCVFVRLCSCAEIAEQMAEQALNIASVSSQEAVMKQQAEIARVKADQEATVLRIQQEQENANRLSIAQTKKEAALMEADALVIAAEGQRKAAAMQGSQYGEHPSLLQIRLAEIQAAVMAKASISIMVAPDQVSHAMGAFANMGQFLQMAGGSSAPAPAGSVSGAKIAMSSSSSSSK